MAKKEDRCDFSINRLKYTYVQHELCDAVWEFCSFSSGGEETWGIKRFEAKISGFFTVMIEFQRSMKKFS